MQLNIQFCEMKVDFLSYRTSVKRRSGQVHQKTRRVNREEASHVNPDKKQRDKLRRTIMNWRESLMIV